MSCYIYQRSIATELFSWPTYIFIGCTKVHIYQVWLDTACLHLHRTSCDTHYITNEIQWEYVTLPPYHHQGNLATIKTPPPEQFSRDRFLDRFLDDPQMTLSTNFHRHNHWPLPQTITTITLLTWIQASTRQKIQPICPAPHLIGNVGNPSSDHSTWESL